MITKDDINEFSKNKLEGFWNEEKNEKFREAIESIIEEVFEKIEPIFIEACRDKKLIKIIKLELVNKIYNENKNRSAFAAILEDKSYEIHIKFNFARNIFIYAELIQEKFKEYWQNKFNIDNFEQDEVRNFLFSTWILIILNHEFGHIVQGHLDLLIDKNMIDYYGNSKKQAIIDGENKDGLTKEKIDIWLAVEAEADIYGTQAAFGLLPQVNTINNFLQKKGFNINNTENVFSIFGDVLCAFYQLYKMLYSSSDVRHPNPFIRMYLSATAFNQYCKIKIKDEIEQKRTYQHTVITILKSYEEITELLECPKNRVCDKYNAVRFLRKVDKVINQQKFDQFRMKKEKN